MALSSKLSLSTARSTDGTTNLVDRFAKAWDEMKAPIAKTAALRNEIVEAWLTGRLDAGHHLVRVTSRRCGGEIRKTLWIDGKINGQIG
jgi:hypothetical protein